MSFYIMTFWENLKDICFKKCFIVSVFTNDQSNALANVPIFSLKFTGKRYTVVNGSKNDAAHF